MAFSKEEKRNYKWKKHLKEHLFEYVLDFIGPILLTVLILYLCKAEKFLYGVILSVIYSAGKTAYRLYHVKKEHIDIDIK